MNEDDPHISILRIRTHLSTNEQTQWHTYSIQTLYPTDGSLTPSATRETYAMSSWANWRENTSYVKCNNYTPGSITTYPGLGVSFFFFFFFLRNIFNMFGRISNFYWFWLDDYPSHARNNESCSFRFQEMLENVKDPVSSPLFLIHTVDIKFVQKLCVFASMSKRNNCSFGVF